MAWAKLDDGVGTHPKILRLDPQAFTLWVLGIVHCCRHLTDGLIEKHVVPTLHPRVRHTAKATGTLVQAGLWHPTEGGFRVHDFLSWNSDRASVELRKAADRNRKNTKNRPVLGDSPLDSTRNPVGIRKDSRIGVGSSSVLGESAREPSALERRFATWWERYPRKVGRKAAWREWERLAPDDDRLTEMLAVLTLQRQSHDWVKEGGRFIPHPRTYLAQGRHEDLVEATRDPGPVWAKWDDCAACGGFHIVGDPCERQGAA